MTDLETTIAMFKRARVDHRHWAVRERENGVVFHGTCLVVGVDGIVGPLTEYLFDVDGKLIDVTPTQQTFDSILIARTSNNRTVTEDLLADQET